MIFERERPKEKCGVVGIYGVNEASRDAYFGLFALQHRGQESAGITTSYYDKMFTVKGPGLVPQVFSGEDIENILVGDQAIAHVRYSTSQGSDPRYAQPVNRYKDFALAHNGNLPDTGKLDDFLDSRGIQIGNLNDTEKMYEAIYSNLRRGASLPDSIAEFYKLSEGVFACVAMTKNELVAFQDRCAMKPLSIGTLREGYAVASETCALDTMGARFLQDIQPGHMVVFRQGGMQDFEVVKGELKRDSWEYVYFAMPASTMLGRNIGIVREDFGEILYREHPVDADIVVGVPNSGIEAAIGYSHASKIPFQRAIIKNQYIGRTFIQPSQQQREADSHLKLNPIPEMLEGKRVLLTDDSIVRGTTTPRLVRMVRNAGAAWVGILIASSPYTHPDYYGTDTPIQEPLIASKKNVEEIREFTGADYLGYLSIDGVIEGIGLPRDQLSLSWCTGEYPIGIGENAKSIYVPRCSPG